MIKKETEIREGQISIMVYGAEKFGLNLKTSELDDRNYKLYFEPYNTERRFSEFDGVITFQHLFENFELKSNLRGSWTSHSCDHNELDKRGKEADILIKQGGFVVFILHAPFIDGIYDTGRYPIDCKNTDLVKRFLNWGSLYRTDLNQRSTGLKCVRNEFLKFFELYGAVYSSFNYGGSISWRNLAVRNGQSVSMIIFDCLFFVPCLLPEQRSTRKEEFYRLLADAVVTCTKKLHVELPAWVNELILPNEKTLIEEQIQISERLELIKKNRSVLTKFKRVLIGDGDILVDDVVYLLTIGFGYKVNSDDNYREDIRILNEKGDVIVFGEVKGTTRGVKREYINQADSHRERAGYSSKFPTVIIINTHTKNTRTVQEKDQEVASEQIKHAVTMNVLIIRTLDLLNLLVLVQNEKLSPDDILGILQTEAGWLSTSGEGVHIHKE